MASSSAFDLQQSIFDALVNDPTVTGLLGGPYVFDRVPRDASFPYVTMGQSTSRDWSTGDEDGEEHVLTLHVWSRAGGKKETQNIIVAVRNVLHDKPIVLSEHHLVNLRHEFSDTRRDADGEHFHGIVRYRAVTEPSNA